MIFINYKYLCKFSALIIFIIIYYKEKTLMQYAAYVQDNNYKIKYILSLIK